MSANPPSKYAALIVIIPLCAAALLLLRAKPQAPAHPAAQTAPVMRLQILPYRNSGAPERTLAALKEPRHSALHIRRMMLFATVGDTPMWQRAAIGFAEGLKTGSLKEKPLDMLTSVPNLMDGSIDDCATGYSIRLPPNSSCYLIVAADLDSSVVIKYCRFTYSTQTMTYAQINESVGGIWANVLGPGENEPLRRGKNGVGMVGISNSSPNRYWKFVLNTSNSSLMPQSLTLTDLRFFDADGHLVTPITGV